MNRTRFKLPPLPLAALFDAAVRLLGLALVLAAVVLAGRWLTELSAPRPVARLPWAELTQTQAGLKAVTSMFGAGLAPQSVDGLTLTGVYAGSQGGGFATLRSSKGAVSVFPGEEVVSGMKLVRIEKDRVLLQSADSTRRELRLSTAPADVGVPAPRQTVADAPPQAVPDTASDASPRHKNRNRPGDDE